MRVAIEKAYEGFEKKIIPLLHDDEIPTEHPRP
jgi:hypothetical protein